MARPIEEVIAAIDRVSDHVSRALEEVGKLGATDPLDLRYFDHELRTITGNIKLARFTAGLLARQAPLAERFDNGTPRPTVMTPWQVLYLARRGGDREALLWPLKIFCLALRSDGLPCRGAPMHNGDRCGSHRSTTVTASLVRATHRSADELQEILQYYPRPVLRFRVARNRTWIEMADQGDGAEVAALLRHEPQLREYLELQAIVVEGILQHDEDDLDLTLQIADWLLSAGEADSFWEARRLAFSIRNFGSGVLSLPEVPFEIEPRWPVDDTVETS
jgi:hypothetical protein